MDLSRFFSGRESWEVAQEQRAFYHLLGRGFYLLYLNPEDEAGDTFDQAEWAGSDFPSFKTKQLLGEGEDICCLALVFTYKPHQRSL